MPSIVSEETFVLAEERLEKNKAFSKRRTKTPSVSQGLVACGKCGYALYRTSARTSARKISYYRCLGSDAWRYLNGPLCNSRPVRQELLDDIVWTELVRLLEDPALVKAEIDRRLEAARVSDPNQQREADLRHRLIRIRKSIDRLVTAYQEELITIDELRARTPELRRQEQALHRELESAVDRAKDRETYLRLAETLTGFLARLRSAAETLDIAERQRIVRLLVKEILVTEDKITIRHSIPISSSPGGGPDPSKPGNGGPENESYLLRSGRQSRPLRGSPLGLRPLLPVEYSNANTFADQPPQRPIGHPNPEHLLQPGAIQTVEEGLNVCLQNPTHLALVHRSVQRTNRVVGATSGPKAVRALHEVLLVHRLQHLANRPLDYLVLDRRYPYRPRPSVSLGDVHSPQWLMSVPLRLHPPVQLYEIRLKLLPVALLAHPVHPHRRVSTQAMKGALQCRHVHQMRQ